MRKMKKNGKKNFLGLSRVYGTPFFLALRRKCIRNPILLETYKGFFGFFWVETVRGPKMDLSRILDRFETKNKNAACTLFPA